jgi:hypothetical protein
MPCDQPVELGHRRFEMRSRELTAGAVGAEGVVLQAEDLDHPPPRRPRKLERLHEARDKGGDLARGEALLDGAGNRRMPFRETLVGIRE